MKILPILKPVRETRRLADCQPGDLVQIDGGSPLYLVIRITDTPPAFGKSKTMDWAW